MGKWAVWVGEQGMLYEGTDEQRAWDLYHQEVGKDSRLGTIIFHDGEVVATGEGTIMEQWEVA